MYVGKKDRSQGAGVLARNGLDTGKLYVFRSLDPDATASPTSPRGRSGRMGRDPERGRDARPPRSSKRRRRAGALTFVRTEDGAFNPRNRREFFFVTTGRAAPMRRTSSARSTRMRLDPGNPLKPATLDDRLQRRRDRRRGRRHRDQPRQHRRERPLSHDQRGRHGQAGPSWQRRAATARSGGSTSRGTAPGVDASSATRVAELDPPGRDGVAVGPGVGRRAESSTPTDHLRRRTPGCPTCRRTHRRPPPAAPR